MIIHEELAGQQRLDIDLGLAVLAVIAPPGQPLTQAQIAAACGCSPQRIQQIEQQALRKLRFRLGKLGVTQETFA